MAAVVKSTKASFDAISATKCVVISELLGAHDQKFAKYDPVYIDSDGKVRPALTDTLAPKFDGFAMSANDSDGGLPVTIMGYGLIMEWLESSDLYTPGQLFYRGAANQLSTTANAGTILDKPIAMAITNREIIVIAGPGMR